MRRSSGRIVIVICSFCVLCAGCVNGPVRYKSLGFFKYATVEIPKMINPANDFLKYAARGPAGVAGAAIDATVVVADTIMTPIVATNLTGFLPPNEGPGDPRINKLIYIPFLGYAYACYKEPGFLITLPYAIFYYPSYVIGLQLIDENDYQLYFGPATGVFKDIRDPRDER